MASALSACRPTPRASGPIPQDAYVWQREWTSNVVASVRSNGPAFRQLVVLAGEVSWSAGQPHLAPVFPDWPALRALPSPPRIGLALRIGPFPGPFEPDDSHARFLRRTARDSLQAAQNAGLAVAELQIDFDCAERRLDGYRIWVEALKQEAAPVPVVITALPSWLNQASFRKLAASTDGFVLQVHSLSRPRNASEPASLCDPEAARRRDGKDHTHSRSSHSPRRPSGLRAAATRRVRCGAAPR